MRTKRSAFGSLLPALGLTMASLLAGTGDAHAWFKVCNLTDKPLRYEHSIYSSSCGSNPWRMAGWFSVPVGQCTTVDSGSMNNRYFYYYAESTDQQYVWTSDATWRWMVPPGSINKCEDAVLGCQTGSGPCPGYRILNHREESGNGTNFTLNLY